MAKKKPPDIEKLQARLERSPAYKVAYYDKGFISEDYSRPVRLQMELMKPEILLQDQKIKSTLVVFGGTRIVEPKDAKAGVKTAEARLRRKPSDGTLKRKLHIAKNILAKSRFYDEAREFGRLVSEENRPNHENEYVIVTGGGPGVMEAANRGAFDVGAKTVGMNITLPEEQEPNPYITPELCFKFHYFAIRKMHFMLRAKALVAFPGGYGTLDELFEALTLVQTEKVAPLPIVLFGEEYWRSLIDFEFLVRQGTIAPEDIELFVYADKAVDAWNYIKAFYNVPNGDV
ncbi:MAG: TIGR00730 family Rossman fold protein [candidate division Zixibacteria bacterium]|nr:TIGR00730 family Rossman fold protein [candidate division Zixibacteria bacterium]MDH3936946.1 TIGR00730 family Rossman fold protein [candidate division Zixibacteria bacterium]MDH4034549.1 TIGR00730 family Rossman fold protein [candidate division Zixibacteria bacterium]